jgi:murein DD-endopeptidase MepM/ murein hydrolase activator NlpD
MTVMEHSMRNLTFALMAMLAPLLAGCMPASPTTVFNWDVNDRLHSHPAIARADSRTYAYRDEIGAPPAPTPRPSPYYVTADATPYHTPAHASSITQSDLPAPGPMASGEIGAVAFAWPVSGTVISNFGSTGTGGRNDGINIATAMRAPIRAAASGTVTYSGNELKDYGNLVLIKHAGGYVTAYAHADKLLVNRGDAVAKGQIIGYAGETGDVNSPQLHFEIRHDTQPVNPRPLLLASASNS